MKRFIKSIAVKLKIDKVDWSDVFKRSLKTFIQAFISEFNIDILVSSDTDISSAVRAMIVAGVAAGICAVWNYIVGVLDATESAEV